MVVMFVIVSLIILASLGVNIGPLIAGAGVIGLAIGFGAQTLVKEIIAGVFFLIDDAFRVGDFIENGIEFAHRNVTVYLPPGEAADESSKKALEAGAAAAAAAQAEEEKMMKQKPK
jgi:small-conductance mechanosensitive channel